MSSKKLIGTLCIIGTTICYGLVPSFSFLAFRVGMETETLLFNKFFIAAILMWAYIFIKKIEYKPTKKNLPMLTAICVAYIGIATTLYLSFEYISGSLATIISFTFPAMIVAIEMITGREPVKMLKIFAVVISMGGLVLIVWSPDLEASTLGIIFALMCALCYVVYTMGISAKSMDDMNSIAIAGYVLVTSAVFNFVRCVAAGQPLMVNGVQQWIYIVLLAIVCAFFAILFFCHGVKLIGPSNAGIINTFEPVFACIFGFLLVGDEITRNMIIGGAMVVLAVLISNLPSSSDGGKKKIAEKENQTG